MNKCKPTEPTKPSLTINPAISRDNDKGTCMLISAVISGDRNLIKKEADKIVK